MTQNGDIVMHECWYWCSGDDVTSQIKNRQRRHHAQITHHSRLSLDREWRNLLRDLADNVK